MYILDCWEGKALRKMEGNMTSGLMVDSPARAPLLPHNFPPVFQITSHHADKTPFNSHPLHSKLKVVFPISSSLPDLDSGPGEKLLEGFCTEK